MKYRIEAGPLPRAIIMRFAVLFALAAFPVAAEERYAIPGQTTVAELTGLGYHEASAVEWKKAGHGTKNNDERTFLGGRPDALVVKKNLVYHVIFDLARGERIPAGLLGVSLDFDSCSRDFVAALVKSGFECRHMQNPLSNYPLFASPGGYSSRWTLYARNPQNPGVSYIITMNCGGFWSDERQKIITRVEVSSGDEFEKARSPVTGRNPPADPGDERERALDLAVALSLQNDTDYAGLAPVGTGKKDVEPSRWKGLLKDSWDIESREQYFAAFDDIVAEGQTKSCDDIMALLDMNPGLSPEQIALYTGRSGFFCDQVYYVLATRDWLGERSLRAWDLGRLISVTRWAFAAGYISEEEAWDRILPIAKTIYETYGSREDFLVSYAAGRGFFGADDHMKRITEILRKYALEMGKADSRQHLDWDNRETAVKRDIARPARVDDLDIRKSPEWNAADDFFAAIDDLSERLNSATESGETDKALACAAKIRERVMPLRDGDFYPPLYYSVRYTEGIVLLKEGNKATALEAFREIEAAYPDDENVKGMIGQCLASPAE